MAIRFRFRFRSMQSALEGIDMRVEGKKLGANYVSDVALPIVLRMQLAQPIIAGDDATPEDTDNGRHEGDTIRL